MAIVRISSLSPASARSRRVAVYAAARLLASAITAAAGYSLLFRRDSLRREVNVMRKRYAHVLFCAILTTLVAIESSPESKEEIERNRELYGYATIDPGRRVRRRHLGNMDAHVSRGPIGGRRRRTHLRPHPSRYRLGVRSKPKIRKRPTT